MGKKKKVDSKEIGLEMGLILAKYFFDKEHLHYGYWTDDLEVDFNNLPQAQENYSHFLISHIPDGVHSILDVGCGVGWFASMLTERGYKVDCVSPSSVLAQRAGELLGDETRIFKCRYEDLQTEDRYDLVVFSESFQYIKLETALQQTAQFLNPDGHLLIADFFKTEATGKNYIGGGHRLTSFYDLVSRYPFTPVKDLDITSQTAPTLDIANEFLMDVLHPIWTMVLNYMESNYPFLSRLVKWKYKKKIAKMNSKYFSGQKNSKNFSIFKSYRLFLYQKKSVQTV
ncbi:class I SAM-dependent methyltransferase [candidate division KSB1 bacterium]|nr:class I SAM-dependent methyltransferase [candidate division KSB1 bacterium]